MSKLPVIKPKELIKILKNFGFVEHRQKGSHLILKHSDGQRAVIPIHQGRDIPTGTLRSILNDADIPVDELIKYL
ncbi:hypothetical protein CO134_03840, partial [Candidatus Kuenenbacteria bacterium CG_4_9_14_3_um_filter_39_14]|uniref:Toxin HicA n=2 Tax=Candidatus Kueneniibacteriota TaxID=1752740 RepID=A0A2H0D198_9BACT